MLRGLFGSETTSYTLRRVLAGMFIPQTFVEAMMLDPFVLRRALEA